MEKNDKGKSMNLTGKLGPIGNKLVEVLEGLVTQMYGDFRREVIEDCDKAGIDAEESEDKAFCLLMASLFFIINTKLERRNFEHSFRRVNVFSSSICLCLFSGLIAQDFMKENEIMALFEVLQKRSKTEILEKVKYAAIALKNISNLKKDEDEKVH